jgi:hypothetical protein
VWWYVPIIQATQEAEAEDCIEPRSLGPLWQLSETLSAEKESKKEKKNKRKRVEK